MERIELTGIAEPTQTHLVSGCSPITRMSRLITFW